LVLAARSGLEVEEDTSALGPGWKPGVPVEEAGGSEWRNAKIIEENGTYEEEIEEENEEGEVEFKEVEREYSEPGRV
jgi:hypothetical protein